MENFEFEKSLKKLEEFISEGLALEAGILYDRIRESLDLYSDEDKYIQLESYSEKINDAKQIRRRNEVLGAATEEFFNSVIKEQKRQFEVMTDIRWYLKFFFWLAVIGLILMVISWLV
ncbi:MULTISPECIES: hypothetical protein [Rhodonellum]|uniref:Uncharacterized protein n=1 Tax=Rhodonellum ikkaensis TaxID=336829 RepID=A0A1H3UDD3_9BACT|nr:MULTISPECIES: hypothetical protein [Rhodonellum]SDZ59659.1 hypothetical protein SAMN05444412_1481 [Rhodonellum ikkaensis]